jgi:hypothetical protein
MSAEIRIEPRNASRAEGAAGFVSTVWGHVFERENARAVYYVRWNEDALEEVEVVVSVGEWGEGSGAEERACVAALGRNHQGRLSLMLVDAERCSFSEHSFLGKMCAAEEARGTPLATEVFHIVDHLLVDDPRVVALRQRIEHMP